MSPRVSDLEARLEAVQEATVKAHQRLTASPHRYERRALREELRKLDEKAAGLRRLLRHEREVQRCG